VRVPSQDYLCAPASCTITANPSSITEGQSTKLIWSATSPDGSNYSGKISHSLGSDTYPVSQASSGNFSPSQSITYTFSGTFSSGPFSCSVPVVVTSVRPSVDLQVRKIGTTLWLNPTAGSPLRIGVSDEVELKWDSLNATSCTSGDFTVPGGSVNGRTSDVVEPAVGSTKPYTITCTNGSDTDLDSVVTVAAPPPTVTTQVQSNVTQTGATLNGTANPNGTATTGWFRYRTSSPGSCNDSFGTRVPSSGGTSLGSGTSGVNFSRAISGLVQNTTYYYCAIAENAGGKAYGAVRSFTMTATASTCTLSVFPSTVNQPSGATLSWNSSNANWFHISSVGYVTPNTSSSALVAPSQTTTYTGTVSGQGGTNTCSATLTIRRSCALPWGGTITHGQSRTAYQASTVPYNQSCVSQTRTCNDGTLSGSYTHISCSVGAPANCTLDGVTVNHGQSRTFYSTRTAPSGQLCSSYDQTRTCTNGTLSGPSSYQYASCSCTPTTVYSCSTNNVVRTVTNSSCNVTVTNPYATCTSPAFCSPGSATCLVPTVIGELHVSRTFVRSGEEVDVWWDVKNATSCTVSGNGKVWKAKKDNQLSGPLEHPTTFTLTCDGGDEDKLEDDLVDTEVVQIVPMFQEV